MALNNLWHGKGVVLGITRRRNKDKRKRKTQLLLLNIQFRDNLRSAEVEAGGGWEMNVKPWGNRHTTKWTSVSEVIPSAPHGNLPAVNLINVTFSSLRPDVALKPAQEAPSKTVFVRSRLYMSSMLLSAHTQWWISRTEFFVSVSRCNYQVEKS